jgi:hypothetical protein
MSLPLSGLRRVGSCDQNCDGRFAGMGSFSTGPRCTVTNVLRGSVFGATSPSRDLQQHNDTLGAICGAISANARLAMVG